SNWSARALAKVLPVTVDRFAPFDAALIESPNGRHAHSVEGVPERYVLTTFDAKSFLSRKNPEGVIELWRRVADDHPDRWLVIKSSDLRDYASPELLDLIELTPRVRLVDRDLPFGEYLDLLDGCDVFVSLHRSEGMGLTPIEAGLAGKPVVYTNYGGVVDFLDGRFFPVEHSMVRVGDSTSDTGPYDRGAHWAEPDLDDAERQLRRALTSDTDDEATTALIVDRKQLVENLITAQQEVVATAERLWRRGAEGEAPESDVLIAGLLRPRPAEGSDTVPAPHRLFLIAFAPVWVLYKSLPRLIRRQVHLALHWEHRRSNSGG
ncbi:MAG TPA: glycosyltransferase, partial [Acidimicrobiales bacterium]|nr:glycosyltransferase [Acidimicrobiales bacterium]